MGQKSLFKTYVLWFFFGFFGLHHHYLGRDRHSFIFLMFPGGYFGLGWIIDFFKIPTYVKDANDDQKYLEELTTAMRKHKKPPTSIMRYATQITVGNLLGFLASAAVPKQLIPEAYWPYTTIFVPLGVAVGVHMIGNIGRHQGSLRYPLLGAYLMYPFFVLGWNTVSWMTFISIMFFNKFSKEWRRKPSKEKPYLMRLLIIMLCSALYLALWSSYIYYNCTISMENEDEEIQCRVALKRFFKSPLWQEFISVMKDVWQFAQYHGWKEVFRHLVEAFDLSGEANALKVLGLQAGTSQQEITAQYRKLSRQWHPDKHHDPKEKEIAQEKFIEIQQAYELLSGAKSQRVARNSKD